VKTIHNSYMVAAGLPLRQEDHAARIADMALKVAGLIKSFNRNYSSRHTAALPLPGCADAPTPKSAAKAAGVRFGYKIGIASGRAVAGVIGKSMLCYDVWGDTVNTASRMYSTCITGHVQCTKETKDLLDPTHHLTKRGQVQVKGKGLMTTYFVNRRRITVNKSLGDSRRGVAAETYRGSTMCEDDENWVVGVTGRDKNQAESDSEMRNERKGGERDSPNITHSRDSGRNESGRTDSNASDLTEDDPNYQSTPGVTPPGHSRRLGSSLIRGESDSSLQHRLSGKKGRMLGHSSSASAADHPNNNKGHSRRQSKSERDLRKQIVRRASQSRSKNLGHASSAGSLSKSSSFTKMWSGRKKDPATNNGKQLSSNGSSSVVEAEDALDFTEGRLRRSQSSEGGSSSMMSTRSNRNDSIEYGLPMSKPKLRSSDSSESGLFSVNLVKKTLDRKLSKGQLLQDDDMGDVDRMANVANKREARRRSLVGGDAPGLGGDSALKAAIAAANALYNDAGGELGMRSPSTSVGSRTSVEDSSQSSAVSERPVSWGRMRNRPSSTGSGLGRGSFLNPNSSVGPIEKIGEDEDMSGSDESERPLRSASIDRYPSSPHFETTTPKRLTRLTSPVIIPRPVIGSPQFEKITLSPPEAEDDDNDDNDVGSGDILVNILDDSPRGVQFLGEGEFEAKQVSLELRVLTPSKSFRERGKRGGSLRRREDEDLHVDFDPDLALPTQVTELALSTKTLSPEGARAEETLAAARKALWASRTTSTGSHFGGANNRLRRKSNTDDGGESFHRRGLSAPITPANSRVTRGKSTGSPRHRGSPPITVVKTYDEAEEVRLRLGGTPRGASRKGGNGTTERGNGITGTDKRKFFLQTNPSVFSSSDYSQPSPTDLRSRTHPPRQPSSSGRQDYSSSGQQGGSSGSISGHGTMDREQAQSSSYRHHSSTLESQMDDEELLSTQFESEGLIHAMRMTRGDTMEYVEMDGLMKGVCVCMCVCVCVCVSY